MMKIQRIVVALAAWTALLATGQVLASGEPIGYVKTVSGDVTVMGAGEPVHAILGSPLEVGSTLKTAANGSVGFTLRDNTLISLGPNTEFTVRDFAFEPGEGKLSLIARLTRGTLNYVSGVIAKLRPEAVSVETPTGTLSVRGTQFVAKVADD